MMNGIEPQPFDFVIDGGLVRLPLEQFVLAKGISAVIYKTFDFFCFRFFFSDSLQVIIVSELLVIIGSYCNLGREKFEIKAKGK